MNCVTTISYIWCDVMWSFLIVLILILILIIIIMIMIMMIYSASVSVFLSLFPNLWLFVVTIMNLGAICDMVLDWWNSSYLCYDYDGMSSLPLPSSHYYLVKMFLSLCPVHHNLMILSFKCPSPSHDHHINLPIPVPAASLFTPVVIMSLLLAILKNHLQQLRSSPSKHDHPPGGVNERCFFHTTVSLSLEETYGMKETSFITTPPSLLWKKLMIPVYGIYTATELLCDVYSYWSMLERSRRLNH